MNTNREQRCIQLFNRFKAQFLRSLQLDDAEKDFYPSQSSNEFNRLLADRYAADFCMLMIRFTSHMGVDDFNNNWFFFSDFIYQDEDLDCQHAIESKQKEEDEEPVPFCQCVTNCPLTHLITSLHGMTLLTRVLLTLCTSLL